uniref:Uncharacterized protein n=1 Tax=Anopheles albimanus TaxID=7167 RepID=A0A182FZ34_ANOAL
MLRTPSAYNQENGLLRRFSEPNFFSASSSIFSLRITSKGAIFISLLPDDAGTPVSRVASAAIPASSVSSSEGKSSKLMLLNPIALLAFEELLLSFGCFDDV